MDLTITALVLASAALHPIRDLLVKGGEYRESAYLGITVIWIVLSAIHTVTTGSQFDMPFTVWPMVGFSTLGLVLYYLGITISLKHGELSVYYPIIRSSPLLIVVINFLLFGYQYETLILVGIVLTVAGAFYIQYRPGSGLFNQPVFFFAAFMSMVGHSVLTIADARAMAHVEPAPFMFWVYCCVFVTQIIWFRIAKPSDRSSAQHMLTAWSDNTLRVLFAGILSYISYIFILVAFQLGGEAATVASVRQVSIPISVLLGVYILHEGRLGPRLSWSLVLAAGIAIIVFVK